MLHFDVHNTRADARSGVVVFEVRDSDDFTVYIGWQTVTIDPGSDNAMMVSWIPPKSGEYVIRAFALKGLEGDDVQSWSQIYESGQLFVNPD
jgi:hypothetical protein